MTARGTTAMSDFDLESLISGAREEQREAIRSLEPLIVVSAGAGAGKTRTLASRFAWLLASDPECKVDQILTLTFTNAAASEMRERIGRTLREWRDAGVAHLTDALARLDEAYISTIHAFSLRVIRESGISLDIDPRSRVVDTPTRREFWNDLKWRIDTGALDKITEPMPEEWRAFAGSLQNRPDYAEFMSRFKSDALLGLGESACEMYGSMNERPPYLRDGAEGMESEARQRLESILEPKWREAWELWHGKIFTGLADDFEGAPKSKFADAMRDIRNTWLGLDCSGDAARDFFISLVNGALASLPGRGALKDAISEHTGGVKEWRDARREAAALSESISKSPPFGEGEAGTRDLLNGFAALFWERWDEARREKGVLSFSDFTRYAALALADAPSYAARFRHIMIDEFQDTDGLQDSIIRALSGAWPGDGPPRTAFIVGDVKQSIYRFRHSNPRLFAGYMSAGSRVAMSRSYRMSGALMDRVNMVFGHIWRDGVIRGASPPVPYEPLLPPDDAQWWGERNGGRSPRNPMEIILYRQKKEDAEEEEQREGVGEQRKKLALGLATRLVSMIDGGAEVWDKDSSSFRPMKWGDVAVLTRTRTSYPQLEEAFGEAGVPFTFDHSRDYINRGEVRDLIAFLSLLDRPDDELALAGWMESPFSGIAQGAGMEAASRARANGTPMTDEFERAHPAESARLAHLRRAARFISPSKAVGALLEDDSWLASYPERNRDRVLANVRRGVEMLAEYESSCGRNLASCADYLRREMRSGEAIDEPGAPSNGGDAVRVMTVHSSKGLEFPAVALMFMESTGRGNSRDGAAFVSRSLGAIPRALPDGSPSARRAWHRAIEEAEEAEESERMLYVAMTRAQDILLCCGLRDKMSKDGSDWMSMTLAANYENGEQVPVTYADGESPRGRQEASSPEKPPRERPKLPAWGAVPRVAMLSATAYSLLSWCPAAYRIRYRQGRELKWERRGADSRGGADLGTLTHWILSRWDFRAGSLEAYLPGEMSDAAARGEITEIPPKLRHVWRVRSNRDACRGWLEAFSASEAGAELREALESGALAREVAFSVETGGVNIVGGIDVFWTDDRGCHVRDWKITPEDDAPHEMYQAQIEFYAAACRAARPELDVDAGLIYLRDPGRAPDIRAVEDWDSLTHRIQEAAGEAASSGITRRGDCARCPFAPSCPEQAR
jgi:ATP-dependent exoDNAse (exonuclease V) beta subunit